MSDDENTPDNAGEMRGRDGKGHFTKDHPGVFQPGNTVGAAGRPKGIDIRKQFENYLLDQDDDGRTRLDELVEGVFEHAMKGNSPYMNQLFDRTFGKVRDEDGAVHPTTVVFNVMPKVNDEE